MKHFEHFFSFYYVYYGLLKVIMRLLRCNFISISLPRVYHCTSQWSELNRKKKKNTRRSFLGRITNRTNRNESRENAVRKSRWKRPFSLFAILFSNVLGAATQSFPRRRRIFFIAKEKTSRIVSVRQRRMKSYRHACKCTVGENRFSSKVMRFDTRRR